MRNTIKLHKDFLMPDNMPKHVCMAFIVRARPTMFTSGRYGITATKKTMPHATDRNRAKRLLRVWIAANEKNMPDDIDYVFIVRKAILDIHKEDGISMLKGALGKVNKQIALDTGKK